MKKVAFGISCFLLGFGLAFSTSAYGESVVKKVESYLRPDYTLSINGDKIDLKNVPIIYNDSTYLPVRELAETMGKQVQWTEETKNINLISKKEDDFMTNQPVEEKNAQEKPIVVPSVDDIDRQIAKEKGLVFTKDATVVSKIGDIAVLEYNGFQYFSRNDFLDKFDKEYQAAEFKPFEAIDLKTGYVFYNKNKERIGNFAYPGKEGFWIILSDGSSWISTDYFPEEFRNK